VQYIQACTLPYQVRQAETSINNIRSLAQQLENEFRILETLVTQQRRLM
jgi:hypothetical protein